MHRAEDFPVRLGVYSVGQLGEPIMQASPEIDPISNRWRRGNRAEARDVLVADLPVDAAGLD